MATTSTVGSLISACQSPWAWANPQAVAQRLAHPENGHRVFGADVHIALSCPKSIGGYSHAFQHAVGVALQNGAVHERAWVAFIGVTDNILLRGFLTGRGLPLDARGETAAPSAPHSTTGTPMRRSARARVRRSGMESVSTMPLPYPADDEIET